MKTCLLAATGLVYSRAHSSCGCLHKIQPVNAAARSRERLMQPQPELRLYWHPWLLGIVMSFFLRSETNGRFPASVASPYP